MHDVVIVGAGSAGCALARNLSDHDIDVCLLEAGGEPTHPDIGDPTRYYELWRTPLASQYYSVPQRGTGYRRQFCPSGRVLGGSSAINGMVYFRGTRHDYDHWAFQGCRGWAWDQVVPAFEKLEALLDPRVVERPNPTSETFLQACEERGHQRSDTFESGDLVGAGWNRSTIVAGRRRSAYDAFIAPVRSRTNLHVVPAALALRVELDTQGVVSGVEYADAAGRTHRVRGEQTILCAGAYDTPKLLLLSGIGPARELEALGIKPVLDLPVGRNLIDHVLLGVVFRARRPLPPEYPHLTEATLFAKSSEAEYVPDLQISYNKEEHFAEGYDVEGPAYSIIPGIIRPRSRGFVGLESADPREPPLINPGHLEEEADRACMLRGVRMAREIGMADAFGDWRRDEAVPGCEIDDDDALLRFIEHTCSTWFHPVGTCRMGVNGDAVVTPDLEVVGASGLRVADASIMPDIVSCNTNGASTMIGWRAGDLVAS